MSEEIGSGMRLGLLAHCHLFSEAFLAPQWTIATVAEKEHLIRLAQGMQHIKPDLPIV